MVTAALLRTMAITGANGNIGQKIAAHLLQGTKSRHGDPPPGNKSRMITKRLNRLYVSNSGGEVQWHIKLMDDYEGSIPS